MARIDLQQKMSRIRLHLARRLGRRSEPRSSAAHLDFVEQALEPYVRGVREQIAPLTRGDKLLLVGPFDGEVGFELLYWVPLVRWIVREFPELEGRLVVVSRGGVQRWYTGIGARYIDIFSLASPDEVLRRRVSSKQQMVSDFDRDIYARARDRLGLDATNELHPSLLFAIYYRLLKVDRYAFARSVRRTERGASGLLAEYSPMDRVPLGPLEAELPDEYVAVRFYSRPSFPDCNETRAFARSVVVSLARHTNVVLLNNGMELDDHADHLEGFALPERVHSIDHLMTPETNLDVQTAAIGRSRAFVGTYGGLSYLAPYLGVPSVGFSTLPEYTFHGHLNLAERVFDGPRWGRLRALEPADVELLGALAGRGSHGSLVVER